MRSSRSQGVWGDGEAGGPSCSGGGDRGGVRGGVGRSVRVIVCKERVRVRLIGGL